MANEVLYSAKAISDAFTLGIRAAIPVINTRIAQLTTENQILINKVIDLRRDFCNRTSGDQQRRAEDIAGISRSQFRLEIMLKECAEIKRRIVDASL